MSSTEDLDDDLLQSEESNSVESLSQPLLQPDISEVNKEPNKHMLDDHLLVERNRKLAKVCLMITVVLERAAYYGLLGNLAFFTNVHLSYEADESVNVTLGFSGFTWISCFIGGILGDAFLGRFKTISTGLIFYIIGYINLTLLAYHNKSENDGREVENVVWFLFSLVLVSLGEGCFKSNMSPFGADQIDNAGDNSELRSFFNYYYWAINVGSFIGFSLIVWIQVEYNFFVGYLVPCILLCLAMMVFILPRVRNYHINLPKKSVNLIFKIILNSMRRNRFV